MSLQVLPSGGKAFIFRYRRPGTRKGNILTLGRYPDLSLKDARQLHREAREMLAQGVDPSEEKKRRGSLHQGADTFEVISKEWFNRQKEGWASTHARTVIGRLNNHVFPFLAGKNITEIEAPEILSLIRRIEGMGSHETAHRLPGILSQVFRYAIATGRATRDPAADLKGALGPRKPKHLAAITDPKQIGPFLRVINGYEGTPVVRCALRLAPLVFVRPGELRRAEWAEIDFNEAEWKIPPEKMKKGREHIVPLSRQALEILQEIHPHTGAGRYVFPSARSASRPMSENALNGALRALGIEKKDHCAHGFRAMASTNLNKQGWDKDVIERQLAHVEGNSVRAAYNHYDYLPERHKMMQAWADYLDGLREGGNVVPMFLQKKNGSEG